MSDTAAAEVFEELSLRTRSIFSARDQRFPEFHGSGFLTRAKGSLFLVTARHVLEEWSETEPLFFDAGPNERIRKLEGSEYFVLDADGNEVDAAVLELSQRASAGLDENLVVPISLLSEADALPANARCAIAGYPVAKNRKAVSRSAPVISPSLYGAVTSEADPSKLKHLGRDSADYLALNWKRKATYSLRGEKRTGPKLNGLSGAPIWSIGEAEPSVEGVLIEYHGLDIKCILGIRSRLIVRAVGL